MKHFFILFYLLFAYRISAQSDFVKFKYITKNNESHNCFLSVKEAKKLKHVNRYKVIFVTTSPVSTYKLFLDTILQYDIKGFTFKFFTVEYNNDKVSFFAQEIVAGYANLFIYDGEKLDHKPVYIFRKQNELEFNFLYTFEKVTGNETSISIEQNAGDNSIIPHQFKFYDEQPFLEYFRNYLSDCNVVNNNFKAKRYTFENVELMFRDYNLCK